MRLAGHLADLSVISRVDGSYEEKNNKPTVSVTHFNLEATYFTIF
jgi:hypothetical protein